MSAPSFFFYSHDGCGLGHIRRNLAVASAVAQARPDARILLATGSDEVAEDWLPEGADTIKLPGVRKAADGRYEPRRLPVDVAQVLDLRRDVLAAAVAAFRPDVLVADKHPAGIEGELAPALEAAKAYGGRCVLGLRDILDDPVRVRCEWSAQDVPGTLARLFDRVLVFGTEAVVDHVGEYGLSASVAERVRFCGYVANPKPGQPVAATRRGSDGAWERPLVVATAGGGEDGAHLLETFLDASASAPWEAMVVAGPLCGAREAEAVRRRAMATGARYRRFVPNLAAWFAEAGAIVTMGGYNSLTEAVALGTPTVCVPRVRPRREQLIRARLFASLGLVRLVEPEVLDAARLRGEIEAALAVPRAELARKAHSALDFCGAERAADELLELAAMPMAVAA